MSGFGSPRAALSRTLVVLVVACGALVVTAGSSLASAVDQVNANSLGATVSSGPAASGISLGTLTWALVGFALLVLGFVAASRSGRRQGPVSTSGLGSTVALGLFQHPNPDAQEQPTSAVATV